MRGGGGEGGRGRGERESTAEGEEQRKGDRLGSALGGEQGET